MNLADAYRNTNRKLSGGYLASVETEFGNGVEGEDLVKMVTFINNNLLKIRKAIKLHGKEFIVPTQTSEIPEDDKELFKGCWKWTR